MRYPGPEFVLYLVPMVIAMLRAGWNENLDAITSALRQAPGLAAQAQRVLDMPDATVKANLVGQPPDVRERAHRLIDAAIEGHFDTGRIHSGVSVRPVTRTHPASSWPSGIAWLRRRARQMLGLALASGDKEWVVALQVLGKLAPEAVRAFYDRLV